MGKHAFGSGIESYECILAQTTGAVSYMMNMKQNHNYASDSQQLTRTMHRYLNINVNLNNSPEQRKRSRQCDKFMIIHISMNYRAKQGIKITCPYGSMHQNTESRSLVLTIESGFEQ